MFDFLGYSCYSASWEAFGTAVSVVMWVWFGYLLYRVRGLKRALAAKTTPPQPANASTSDDPRGGRTWDIGATEMRPSPRTRPQRGG